MKSYKMNPIISKLIVMPFEWLYGGAPPNIRIETTNQCNANCVTCPRDEMTRKLGIMDMGLYEKIIHECTQTPIRTLHLHNFGEPLLDAHLFDRIKIAKKRGLTGIKIFSNGSLLTPEKAMKLIESGLDEIKISVDAHSKETFEKIRKKLKFDIVAGNIITLLRLRAEHRKKFPKVTLSFVRMENNIQEEKAFLEYWKKEVDEISIDKVHNWGANFFPLHKNSRFYKPCLRIWNTFTILWNGDVALCCLDYNGRIILGNLRKSSIKDIWRGKKLREIRRFHIHTDLKNIPICENCSKARL